MSDYNSQLPIRTENNGDVVVQLVDGTVTSQKLAIGADGSVNITDNGGSLTVDGTVELGATTLAALETITVTATNLDIRDLAFATDKVDVTGSEVSLDSATLAALENITVSATDLDIRNLAFATDTVDVSGSNVTVDGTVELGATTLAALENITVSATDLDIRDLAFATDKVDVSGSEVSLDSATLAALENITVSATDLDIRDLTATDVVTANIKDATGTAFSAANPLPVSISSVQPGDEINNFNTSAALAAGASSNHDYTVTALKTFLLSQIEASASGKLKIEVQVETAAASGTFVTKFVQFNSTAEPNLKLELTQKITAAAGVKIRVIRTNKDNQSQDVYSTICGSEI